MASQNMKIADIQARAEAAFEQKAQRKRDELSSWKAIEEQSRLVRAKTETLRAQRLAKEAADALAAAAAPPAKPVKRKRVAAAV